MDDLLRVVVTGVSGQLGAEVMRAEWPADVELLGLDRAALDLSETDSIIAKVSALRPDVIVNCGAYTAVDLAEDEEAIAALVNCDAVRALATAADTSGALLIHISTDYVFDGLKQGWYTESDPTGPTGAYGRTKLLGEEAALVASRSIVLRTAWVYGALGANFVATMLRVAAQRAELGVVNDQHGCPTATADIARAIIAVALAPERATQKIYHVASPEAATWYEFATAILGEQIANGSVVVKPLTTDEYPTRARRPANSRLDSSAFMRDFDTTLAGWMQSMPSVVTELQAASE